MRLFNPLSCGVLLSLCLIGPMCEIAFPPVETTQPTDNQSKPICELENTMSIHAVSFLPNSHRILLGGGPSLGLGPGRLTFCKPATLEADVVRMDHTWSVQSIAPCPDGSKVATGAGFGEVKIYDVKSCKVLADLDAGGETANAVAFNSNGRLLANSAEGIVKIWDTTTFQELVRVPDVHTAPIALAFSPDDKFLAFGDVDDIRFWDVAKQQEAFKIPCKYVCSNLLFTPDGKQVIVGGVGFDEDAAIIHFVDLEKKKETRVFKGHTRAVISLALDKEGKYLVSGSGDKTVRIWDMKNGKEILCLTGNQAIVRGLAVSAGNKYLVACSDKLIRVWDFQKLLKSAESHSAQEK